MSVYSCRSHHGPKATADSGQPDDGLRRPERAREGILIQGTAGQGYQGLNRFFVQGVPSGRGLGFTDMDLECSTILPGQ